MRIGLVARFLGQPIGLGTYAANLLQALDRRDDEHEYFVYTPSWNEVPPLGPRFHTRTSPVLRGSRAALTLWDQSVPALAARRESCDLVHYLHATMPRFSLGCPVAISLLDAIPWVLPGYRLPHPYDWLERYAAGHADLVFTISESARADIERVLRVPGEKLRVTYLGGPDLDPEPSPTQPYFLFVGGTERRKNLAAVLNAFDGIEGLELFVVGPNTASQIHDARRDQEGVRWLGRVSDDELVRLYRHATALVFPSLYEGFGLPVLEAMARHTAVIAANRSSIPEAARDAAILIDPDDVEELRDAMRRVAADPDLRAQMTQRGTEVVSSFSWDETARRTVAAYEEFGRDRST